GKDGEYRGGPMYYISEGLGWKWLAILFAIFCMFAAFGMNMVQINTIADTLNGGFKIPKWVSGVVVAIIIAHIIIGGIKRIGKITSYIIPFMCVGFMIMAIVIICINIKAIPSALSQIFKNAFSFKSVGGGVLGYAIMRSMRYGLARGIFSNEAGLGSSVIAHSASSVKEPVRQGLWGIFGVFLDTMVICTLTALVILTSGVYGESMGDISGAMLSQAAFTQAFGKFGTVVFSLILPLFAFPTILSWAYYGEKSFEFIFGKKYSIIFKVIYVALVIVGALTSVSLVWDMADFFNGLMAIPNLIGLFFLGGVVTRITRNYFDRQKKRDVMPMLSAYPQDNLQLTGDVESENDNNIEEEQTGGEKEPSDKGN
ncbi:MAG: alanine/glycine:cation symporter family protein, partial [Clostridia bacterium]|nr:alanine/glycine:cation symporter family protein [Clostridia bacterium]